MFVLISTLVVIDGVPLTIRTLLCLCWDGFFNFTCTYPYACSYPSSSFSLVTNVMLIYWETCIFSTTLVIHFTMKDVIVFTWFKWYKVFIVTYDIVCIISIYLVNDQVDDEHWKHFKELSKFVLCGYVTHMTHP